MQIAVHDQAEGVDVVIMVMIVSGMIVARMVVPMLVVLIVARVSVRVPLLMAVPAVVMRVVMLMTVAPVCMTVVMAVVMTVIVVVTGMPSRFCLHAEWHACQFNHVGTEEKAEKDKALSENQSVIMLMTMAAVCMTVCMPLGMAVVVTVLVIVTCMSSRFRLHEEWHQFIRLDRKNKLREGQLTGQSCS